VDYPETWSMFHLMAFDFALTTSVPAKSWCSGCPGPVVPAVVILSNRSTAQIAEMICDLANT
jgi:hypothetical protein